MRKSQIPQAGQQEVPREEAALSSDDPSRVHKTLRTVSTWRPPQPRKDSGQPEAVITDEDLGAQSH